jgi:hypothetical protein
MAASLRLTSSVDLESPKGQLGVILIGVSIFTSAEALGQTGSISVKAAIEFRTIIQRR